MTPSPTPSEPPLAIFLQRFRLALADLGLPLPADWLTSEDGTALSFGDLTPRSPSPRPSGTRSSTRRSRCSSASTPRPSTFWRFSK